MPLVLLPLPSFYANLIVNFILLGQVVAGLWVLSIVGSWCNFLTLFYISNAHISSLILITMSITSYFQPNLHLNEQIEFKIEAD